LAHEKARWQLSPAGWYFFRFLWPIRSGHSIRRHGGPMMMVVTVMAVDLHLEVKLSGGCAFVK
jgi:hypothetical protein